MRVSASPDPAVVFPAACTEVGDLQIYDDGDEATVVIGNVTHHHPNPYDPTMSPRERAEWVTQEVVAFLRALFDDRVLLWSHNQGKGGGGWMQPYEGVIPNEAPRGADMCVWSRRIESTG